MILDENSSFFKRCTAARSNKAYIDAAVMAERSLESAQESQDLLNNLRKGCAGQGRGELFQKSSEDYFES